MTAPLRIHMTSDDTPPTPTPTGKRQNVTVYPRDAILTLEQVAYALNASPKTVERMDLPYFRAGKMPRYLWGQVLDECARRAAKETV